MTRHTATDFDLLESWRAGNSAAGSALFDRHFKTLYRFFRSKVQAGIDDLVQDTFLACVKARDTFANRSSFRTFLFSVARNTFYRYCKRRYRHDARLDFGVTSVRDMGASPSKVMAQRDEQRLLMEAMECLPVDNQIVLELFYWEDMTGPEIAEVLDIPEPTVRSRLRRARAQLRTKLEELATSPALEESVANTMANIDELARSLRQVLDGGS